MQPVNSTPKFLIAASIVALPLLSACGSMTTAEEAAEETGYQLVEIEHGMTPEEQREWRQWQIEEMQYYVGEIVDGRNHSHQEPPRTETFDIVIENLGQVEHTVWMNQDQGIVYNWEVLGDTPEGGVYFDHHGHPGKENRDEFPEGYFETFETGFASSNSGIVNPGISGYHGWFFINLEERPITVRVTMTGYWERHLEIYRTVAGEVITMVDY